MLQSPLIRFYLLHKIIRVVQEKKLGCKLFMLESKISKDFTNKNLSYFVENILPLVVFYPSIIGYNMGKQLEVFDVIMSINTWAHTTQLYTYTPSPHTPSYCHFPYITNLSN